MTLEKIVKPHIRELAPYEPGKPPEELERELGIEGAIKLASNESPIGPSPRALAAVREELAGVHRYPDGACFDLRAALAKRFGIEQSQLVFGCGADEILELVAKAFLGTGDEAVFATDTGHPAAFGISTARSCTTCPPYALRSPDARASCSYAIQTTRPARASAPRRSTRS